MITEACFLTHFQPSLWVPVSKLLIWIEKGQCLQMSKCALSFVDIRNGIVPYNLTLPDPKAWETCVDDMY